MAKAFCRKCNIELSEDAVFCHICGTKQSVPERSVKRRGNGQGSVYKRGDTWTAEICKFIGTKRVRKFKGGFARKKDAIAYLPFLLQEASLNRTQIISFEELYKKVQDTERYKKLSDSKKTAWRIAYNRCAPLHDVADYREIRFEHMQNIVQGLTYYPARDVKVLLNAMSTLAIKYELCDTNFAELIELPTLDETEKHIFSEEQLNALWKHAGNVPFVDHILAMCYIGLRPIELRNAVVSNIFLDERYMWGGAKTKLSKNSPIALCDKIVPVMERLIAGSQDGQLCTLSEDAFYDSFYAALDIVGIQPKESHILTPVCCRHTYITRLTRNGSAAAVVQKAARHTKYQTTLGYTHMDISDVLDAVNKL